MQGMTVEAGRLPDRWPLVHVPGERDDQRGRGADEGLLLTGRKPAPATLVPA